MDIKEFQKLPGAETCKRIDFDDAEIKYVSIDFHRHLVVNGTKPYLNMDVSLKPMMYIQKPDYWLIEVVVCVTGSGLPALGKFSESIIIDGFIGKKGIEVKGATKSKMIDIQ